MGVSLRAVCRFPFDLLEAVNRNWKWKRSSIVTDDVISGPTSLKHSLTRLIRSKGLANRSAAESLDAEWKRIVGPELAQRSTARGIRAGVVEVVVSNSAALEELRGFLHESVLEQMKASLPESSIRSIRYVRAR
jgi:predicted nucleic acid-binding Zn ribbon protein